MSNRAKKSQRRKLNTLSSTHFNELRQRQIAEQTAARKRRQRPSHKRSQWGNNEYVDDDFVSRLLVKWTLAQLIQYTKLLVLLINRHTHKPSNSSALPQRVSSLVHYKYASEYYETLFADYTLMAYNRVAASEWDIEEEEEEALNEMVPFRVYYTRVYREARDALAQSSWLKQRHVLRLRACFMVALTYDARVRRFVFSKHDIHYEYMETHPPPFRKAAHFIERLQPLVNKFIRGEITAEALSHEAGFVWLTFYMFLLE